MLVVLLFAFALVAKACPPGGDGPIGVPGMTWQGGWVNGTSYVFRDGIYYSGSSYICIADTCDVRTAPPQASVWSIVALKGAQGNNGVPGQTGATGAVGPVGPAFSLTVLSSPADNAFAIGGAHNRFSKGYFINGYFNSSIAIGQNTFSAGVSGNVVSTLNNVLDNGSGKLIVAGAISTAANTPSTSTTTGSVVVTGGVGISGALNVGGAVSVLGSFTSVGYTQSVIVDQLTGTPFNVPQTQSGSLIWIQPPIGIFTYTVNLPAPPSGGTVFRFRIYRSGSTALTITFATQTANSILLSTIASGTSTAVTQAPLSTKQNLVLTTPSLGDYYEFEYIPAFYAGLTAGWVVNGVTNTPGSVSWS